jgi:transposase-like protein
VTTSKKTAGDAGELVLPASADEPSGIEDLDGIAGNLVEEARAKGIALTGQGGLLPALVSRVLETGLQAELTDHVRYEPHAPEGRGSGNSRNGSFAKTLTTEIGEVPIRV